MARHPEILRRDNAVLLVIDIQERLLPAVRRPEHQVAQSKKLIDGCRTLGVPVIVTEQVPEKLGRTAESLQDSIAGAPVFSKDTFSSCGAAPVMEALRPHDAAIVCGMESHVCVQQTTLDLIASGMRVHLAADAVSSRDKYDREIAIARMRSAGAIVTTVESILFELLGAASAAEFKVIQKIVK